MLEKQTVTWGCLQIWIKWSPFSMQIWDNFPHKVQRFYLYWASPTWFFVLHKSKHTVTLHSAVIVTVLLDTYFQVVFQRCLQDRKIFFTAAVFKILNTLLRFIQESGKVQKETIGMQLSLGWLENTNRITKKNTFRGRCKINAREEESSSKQRCRKVSSQAHFCSTNNRNVTCRAVSIQHLFPKKSYKERICRIEEVTIEN